METISSWINGTLSETLSNDSVMILLNNEANLPAELTDDNGLALQPFLPSNNGSVKSDTTSCNQSLDITSLNTFQQFQLDCNGQLIPVYSSNLDDGSKLPLDNETSDSNVLFLKNGSENLNLKNFFVNDIIITLPLVDSKLPDFINFQPKPRLCPASEPQTNNSAEYVEERMKIFQSILLETKKKRTKRKRVEDSSSGFQYTCDLCGMQFQRSQQYYGHLHIHSGERKWDCQKCNACFMTQYQLRRHEKRYHLDYRPHVCSICSATFERLSQLDYHRRRIHEKEKSFKCAICPKAFFKNSDLKTHVSIHLNVNGCVCETCGRRFSHVSNLIRHKRIHSGIKPYLCRACGQRFAQVTTLNEHKFAHCQGTCKPVDCSHCSKSFPPKLIRQHLLDEHGIVEKKNKPVVEKRKYYCKICGERFPFINELKKHEYEEHSSEKQPSCSYCRKKFDTLDSLLKHCCDENKTNTMKKKINTLSSKSTADSSGISVNSSSALNKSEGTNQKVDESSPRTNTENNNPVTVNCESTDSNSTVVNDEEINPRVLESKTLNKPEIISEHSLKESEAIELLDKDSFERNVKTEECLSSKIPQLIPLNNGHATVLSSKQLLCQEKSDAECFPASSSFEFKDKMVNSNCSSATEDPFERNIKTEECQSEKVPQLIPLSNSHNILLNNKELCQEKSDIDCFPSSNSYEFGDKIINSSCESISFENRTVSFGVNSCDKFMCENNGLKNYLSENIAKNFDAVVLNTQIDTNSTYNRNNLLTSSDKNLQSITPLCDKYDKGNTVMFDSSDLANSENLSKLVGADSCLDYKTLLLNGKELILDYSSDPKLSTSVNQCFLNESLATNSVKNVLMVDNSNGMSNPILNHVNYDNNSLNVINPCESTHNLNLPCNKFDNHLFDKADNPNSYDPGQNENVYYLLESNCDLNSVVKSSCNTQIDNINEVPPFTGENGNDASGSTTDENVCVLNHFLVLHSKNTQNSSNKPVYICTHCNKTFDKGENLNQHISAHNTNKCKYQCNICKLNFAWRASFNRHMATHNSVEQPKFSCEMCDKTYLTLTRVQEHVKRDHYNQRPHICKTCAKCFFKKSDLKAHIRTHTQEKPYMCGTCAHTFRHVSHLIRHERIHTGVKPYQCTVCSEFFNQLGVLKKHIKVKHPDIKLEDVLPAKRAK